MQHPLAPLSVGWVLLALLSGMLVFLVIVIVFGLPPPPPSALLAPGARWTTFVHDQSPWPKPPVIVRVCEVQGVYIRYVFEGFACEGGYAMHQTILGFMMTWRPVFD
jgi:hypothetical protein